MLRALVLNCTLKPTPAESSGELLAQQVLDALAEHDVTGEQVRVVDDQPCALPFAQFRQSVQGRDVAVHAEH